MNLNQRVVDGHRNMVVEVIEANQKAFDQIWEQTFSGNLVKDHQNIEEFWPHPSGVVTMELFSLANQGEKDGPSIAKPPVFAFQNGESGGVDPAYTGIIFLICLTHLIRRKCFEYRPLIYFYIGDMAGGADYFSQMCVNLMVGGNHSMKGMLEALIQVRPTVPSNTQWSSPTVVSSNVPMEESNCVGNVPLILKSSKRAQVEYEEMPPPTRA